MKEVTLILRFVVIGLIYVILLRLIKIMLLDLKGANIKDASIDYALEVVDAPDLSGVGLGAVFLVREAITIGRKSNNLIVVNDPFISSNHAVVFLKDGELCVKDLDSTNGIKINNESIKYSSHLKDGDILEIGRIIFKIIG